MGDGRKGLNAIDETRPRSDEGGVGIDRPQLCGRRNRDPGG